MNGITFFFCIGRPVWPRVDRVDEFWRIALGPFSFWVLFQDFEQALALISRAMENHGKLLAQVKAEKERALCRHPSLKAVPVDLTDPIGSSMKAVCALCGVAPDSFDDVHANRLVSRVLNAAHMVSSRGSSDDHLELDTAVQAFEAEQSRKLKRGTPA